MVQKYFDLISRILLTYRAFDCWNWAIFMKIFVLFSTTKTINQWKKRAIKCALRLVLVLLIMINQILLFLIFQKSMFEKLNYISILRDMQLFLRLISSSKMHQDRDQRNIRFYKLFLYQASTDEESRSRNGAVIRWILQRSNWWHMSVCRTNWTWIVCENAIKRLLWRPRLESR